MAPIGQPRMPGSSIQPPDRRQHGSTAIRAVFDDGTGPWLSPLLSWQWALSSRVPTLSPLPNSQHLAARRTRRGLAWRESTHPSVELPAVGRFLAHLAPAQTEDTPHPDLQLGGARCPSTPRWNDRRGVRDSRRRCPVEQATAKSRDPVRSGAIVGRGGFQTAEPFGDLGRTTTLKRPVPCSSTLERATRSCSGRGVEYSRLPSQG